MRVKNITNTEEMINIIKKCEVCYMALVDANGLPYVVPMNFGYSDGYIYLHGAQSGRKMDILKQNTNVAINFSRDFQLYHQNERVACSYSMKYRSVNVEGRVEFIEGKEEKVNALNIIMAQYSEGEFKYNDPAINEVAIYRVSTECMTGRKMHYQ